MQVLHTTIEANGDVMVTFVDDTGAHTILIDDRAVLAEYLAPTEAERIADAAGLP